jgi:hypothetical protein
MGRAVSDTHLEAAIEGNQTAWPPEDAMSPIGVVWHLVDLPLVIVSPIIGMLVIYWVIRLAVRHGIEDARHRGDGSPRTDASWDPAHR